MYTTQTLSGLFISKEFIMEKFEQIFSFINDKAEKYEKDEGMSFLDGVLQALEDVLDEKESWIGKEDNERRSTKKTVQIDYFKRDAKNFSTKSSNDTWHIRASSWLFCRAVFRRPTKNNPISMLDPAVGTGNLLLLWWIC